jgi:tetratricopeptide (TPR) repeat protein
LLLPTVAAFSPFEEGQKLFLDSKPQEALPLLLEALNADPANEGIYLYLGIVYEQLGQTDKSISIMRRGLNVADELADSLYFNIGNNFFRQNENIMAEDMYTKAISKNSGFPEPYLNRANSRINLENYRGALTDYTIYLKLKPETSQRTSVERMIRLLSDLLEDQEREERERTARERSLMNEVLNSLKNASEDALNLSTGTENILEEEEEEIDIED